MEFINDKNTTIIVTALVLFLIALREGMMQRYMKIEQAPKLSVQWHAVGGLIRACLVGLVAWLSWPVWWIVLVAVVLAWPVYNAMINLYCEKRWFFVGTTAYTDKIIRKILWFVKFD